MLGTKEPRFLLWASGNIEWQCGNPHVLCHAAYDAQTIDDAYREVIDDHNSDRWFKNAEARPPYVEHKQFGWRIYYFKTQEEAIAATQKHIEEYYSK